MNVRTVNTTEVHNIQYTPIDALCPSGVEWLICGNIETISATVQIYCSVYIRIWREHSVNQSSHTLTSGCIYNTFMLCNTKTQEMQGPQLCFGLQLYWFSSPLHWSFLLMGCRGHWCFPFHFLVLVFWLVHQVVDFQMSLVLQTSSGN